MRILTITAFLIASFGFLSACSATSLEPVPGKPAHHTIDGFRNTEIVDPNKNFFDFLKMRYFSDVEWADHASRRDEVPIKQADMEGILNPPDQDLQITWFGHSTFLIQHGGLAILTDPIFSDRASPFNFAGPRRYIDHAVDYDALPPIDYVIISHNHYDHLDAATVEKLGDGPRYLVPLGLTDWFVDHGINAAQVQEFDWWDRKNYSDLSIQATPSQHWSARGLGDRRATLWAAWSLEMGPHHVWFAGDTGYNDVQFKETGARIADIDLALIPIGAYLPRDFMKAYHVNPEEAVKIHFDVGAKQSVGMHWGAFPLTAEGPIDPVIDLETARQNAGISEKEFGTMIVGETILLKNDNPVQTAKVKK